MLATRIAGVRGSLYSSSENGGGLSAIGIPQEDRAGLEEAVRRGQVVLSAQVPADQFSAAADVLEESGAVDLETHEAEWRKQGWTGHAAGAMPAGTTQANVGNTAATQHAGDSENIPVVEERLVVGKRETSHGRVRVRSYTVETPVEEQVSLHREHVDVERRRVDRPLAAGDQAFQDRTIEATERAEEAVVGKEARVVEEVVVRKSADDHVETVHDKVRRTEVEVNDERTAAPTQPDRR